MMLHIPAVLGAEELEALRRRLAGAEWIDGRASVGSQGAQVKKNRQLDERSPLAQELGHLVAAALMRNPLFFSSTLPLRLLAPYFNHYEGGEHYGFHVDGSVRTDAATGQKIRTDVSGTLFLCDPGDYDGGELIVSDTYGTHEVKLPAGDLIVYPSGSLHRVEAVTRGARICSFFWLQSMVRNDRQRAMLFELDQSIQKLRGRLGECEESIALTGHYHNLLRMWSEI